jgi:signal transduction histidine kinase
VPLQQAIINLLMNGAEAMLGIPTDKRLLRLACEPAQDVLHIHIDDHGEGIAPELADRIFEPLFTTKPNGMGMGLGICRSIVDAHHGQLDLTLRPSGGTRATITLPRLAS